MASFLLSLINLPPTEMYFTSLPNHRNPQFDEEVHFSMFKHYNIVFNALASKSHCEEHVGCLSFKTVLSGEEWYGVNHQQKVVRPGQFLILNNDQAYSSRIDTEEKVQSLSIFFKKEFAASVFDDALKNDELALNDPIQSESTLPEFFQTLADIDEKLQQQLTYFIFRLNTFGYQNGRVDEDLIFLLNHLISTYQSERKSAGRVAAIKWSTRREIFKRLCIAKDLMHSTFMNNPDLAEISTASCLSVPQLVRQFKTVFNTTPHQYLAKIRLAHAAGLLKQTDLSVNEIVLKVGFENASAFCRAFKMEYQMSPLSFRALN